MSQDLVPGGEFRALDLAIGNLANSLSDTERKQLLRRIATYLRRTNAERIQKNIDPEGKPFEPRKRLRSRRLRDQFTKAKRSVKQSKMFQRATKKGALRSESTSGEAQVGFAGAMFRIMRVHHFGLRDTVTRDPGSPEVTYPERRVLGWNKVDQDEVMGMIMERLRQ